MSNPAPSIGAARVALAASLLVLAGAPFAAAGQTPVHGVVVDEATWTPVDSAIVTLVGTELSTRSLPNGTFVFPEAPLGPATIRVEAPGFPTMTQEVVVRSGTVVYAQFIMPGIDAFLDEIFVVGRRSSEVLLAPRTAADLLVGQVPGIMSNSGMVGVKRSAVQLRGVSSLSLQSDPVVYLDGVRMGGGVGEALSLLSQIPAADVEEIEVLRGPASAFLQGAADGVIHVRTKSGRR